MDIIRLIGVTLVLCGTTMGGYMLSKRESLKIRDLDEMKRSLSILVSEITHNNAPMGEAFRSVAVICPEKTRGFYQFLSDEAAQKRDIPEAWAYACKNMLDKTFLDGDDVDALCRWAPSLKGTDKALIISGQSVINDYVNAKKSALFAKGEKNGRLYRSLGVLCGLMIAVVLI